MEQATRYSPPQDFSAADDLPVWKRVPARPVRDPVRLDRHDELDHDRRPTPTTTAAGRRPTRPRRRPSELTIPVEPTTTAPRRPRHRRRRDHGRRRRLRPLRRRPTPPPTTSRRRRSRRPTTTPASPAVDDRSRSRVALRATVLVTPLLLGALAVPSGGLFRGAKFRDLHLYRQYGDALLDGQLPYRDFFVEYPPGAIPLFAAPSLAPGGAYDAIFKVLMTLCCAGRDLLRRVRARRRRAPAARSRGRPPSSSRSSPIALGPVSLNTYDAWPATADRRRRRRARRRPRTGSRSRCSVRRPRRSSTRSCSCRSRSSGSGADAAARAVAGPLAAFAAVVAVLVVPWLALSPGGVWDSLHSQVGRGLHTESLGASVLLAGGPARALRRARRQRGTGGLARPRREPAATRSPRRRGAGGRSPRSPRADRAAAARRARARSSRRASPASSPSRRCSRRSTSSG